MDRNACTFVLFLLLSIKGLPISGQSENKTFIIPPDIPSLSPEASAVIKYTDYPVDPSSGIPEITVPIYTIQTGDITLPVTLTFHPSGLRPRESSGWVATGWTLNAAPSVVRKANGVPDGLNWNGYRGYLHNTDRRSYNQTYLKNLVEKGLNDETQDDYYYQLPHKSGKLFIRQLSNNAYKMIPESDKNILVTGLPTSGDIFGRITDGDGVAYLFEGMVEMSYYKSIQYPIRWLCTSVESSHYPHSNIGFEYTDFVSTYQETMQNMRGTMIVEDRIWKDGCSYSSYEMDPRFIIDPGSNVKKIYRLQKDTNGKTVYIDTYQTMDVESGYEGYGTPHDNTVRERKLKKIIFPHGSIEFVTSSDLLESIIVRNHEGEISKTVTLHTSRYNPYTELIKLDSVRVFDAGEGVKKYTFQYLSENYVPSKNTQAIDHWGYFNGQTDNNLNAVPKGYFNARHYSGNGFSLINGIANRESNGSAMQAGMLYHITDPQGVVTFFDYEANKIAICATPFTSGPWNTYEPFYYFKEVGGLRVSSKMVSAGDYFKRVIYDYGITSWSSAAYGPYGNEMEWGGGIAPLMVTIDDYCYTQLKNVYDENKKLVRTSRLRTFTTNPVTNITFPNGRTVLYTKVMERVFSNSGKEKRTIYYYKEPHVSPFTCLLYDRITEGSVSENLDFEVRYAYCMAEGTFFPNRKKLYGSSDQYPPFPYDTYVGNWYYKSTGKLYKKEEYTEDRLTYKEEYQYPDRVGQDLPAGAVELFPIEGYNAGHVVWKTNWHQSVIAIANSPYLQDWVDGQKIYDRVNIVVDQAGYMPYTKKTMTRYFSDGSSVVTTEDHGYEASQMHLNPSTIVTTASNGQKQTDVFGYAQVGPNLYKLANHLRKIGEKAVYTFAVFEGLRIKSITKQILLDGDNIYEIGEPVVQASYEYHDGNITNVKQIGQPETGYIWSYKSQYPIAKLVDIPYDAYRHLAVALCNTMPTSSDFNAIKNLQAAYPGAQITTYQYKPLAGITSISDPSGRNSKFVYDEGGKLRLVKDMEDRKITEYEYRLAKYKKTGGSPVIIPPLIISFQHYQDKAPFILNSRVNEFHVDVIAGSGNYKCKWEIEATGTDTGSTVKYVHPANIVNDNRISLSVPSGTNYGRATVTCTVSDTGSNEQKTESFWFYYSIQ